MDAGNDAREQAGRECANCGERGESLLRCSRCHSEWFCSYKCHKSFWPFHRVYCKANEFADAIEAQEPKFAAFLRKHGKQAVLGDSEVERLERAGHAVMGPSREEVMHNMYGRVDPRPAAPSYSADELRAMAAAHALEAARVEQLQLDCSQGRAWHALIVPQGMGMDCGQYKWRQNLSHVELFWRLPPGVAPPAVQVSLTSQHLTVCVLPRMAQHRGRRQQQQQQQQQQLMPTPQQHTHDSSCSSSSTGSGAVGDMGAAGVDSRSLTLYRDAAAAAAAGGINAGGGATTDGAEVVLDGKLIAPVQLAGSTWYLVDGVLHVVMLKAMRKGRYAPGATAADTFWRSLWACIPPGHTLTGQHPPSHYYMSRYEEEDVTPQRPLPPRRLPAPTRTRATAKQQQQQQQQQQQLVIRRKDA